jgi:diketogulonate reductase-like aldo/keto reductase
VGRAIRDSGVPREDLFVMTMVPQWHMGEVEAAASLNVSLQQLGLDYVDLVMLHWPGIFAYDIPMFPPGDPRCGGDDQPACAITVRAVCACVCCW